MKTYLEQADQFITRNITGITRRNRVVARATNLYIQDPKNFPTLYKWYSKDIVKDDTRAQHHGVAIGTQVGWITSPKDKEFFSKVARIKKQFRTMMLTTNNNPV
jgi:hypothetical protein